MAPPASPRPLSRQLTQSSSTTSNTDNVDLSLQKSISPTTTWTEAQESRLHHCQAELRSAQKRWSASQELWIEEVEHLSDLKKKHMKALKKQDARAKRAVGIWKRRTWKRLSRKGSGISTPVTAPVTREGSEDENEDEDEYERGGEERPTVVRRISWGVAVETPRPPPPAPSFSSNPSSRRPSISVTLRKLSVGGIRRRSTAPEGEIVDSGN